MATIDWDESLTPAVASMRMTPIAPIRMHSSPYDQTVQTVGRPGGKWRASLRFNRRHPDLAPALQAMIASLLSGANRLRLWPLERPVPRGTVRGEPTVDQPGQTGTAIGLQGLQPGMDWRAGDYALINGQLVMATQRSVAGPDGKLTFYSNFPLLTAPSSGAPVAWDRPSVLWIIDPSAAVGWERESWWTEFDSMPLIQVPA